jgi:hypothetical protein
MVRNARDLFRKSPKTIYKIQMGRKTIQIIWIPSASHPNYILTTNGETNSKRSTNLRGTLSSDGVINNINSQISTSKDSNINPKIRQGIPRLTYEAATKKKHRTYN